MKNTTLIAIVTLVVLIIGGFVFLKAGAAGASAAVTTGNANNGLAQQITLGIKNSNYYPNTITVKSGQPVELTLDNSVQGCLRSFTIPDLGVRGYSSSPTQKITFTPGKKGTFRFACSMGMGYGTIIVE